MREENQQWSNKKCLVKGRPEWGSENRIWEVSVNWFSVNPKGNQSGIFIGRTDAEAEAEAPMLWPPDVKNWLNGKDPDAGKDWRQEKGTTEDEMVGWLHWLDGHESEQVLGVGDEQGSLACCSPWGHSWTWRRYWTELIARKVQYTAGWNVKWGSCSGKQQFFKIFNKEWPHGPVIPFLGI